MLFTLHRYIFREVFKVFVLAVAALTLMMSIGSILRPVQEFGVGPGQVIDLMIYFLPITLTFVLPMAALFATTLVYGRFAADNELDACRASGIPLLPLVYPGLALAVMVAIANIFLSFYVMPAFVLRAEASLKNDARQILFRNIQRKGYYVLPPDEKYRIYADYADAKNDSLFGLVAAESAPKGGIKKIITADSAKITFIPHEKFNEVRISAHNTIQLGPDEEAGFSAEWLSINAEFGSLLGDNVKFKKIHDLKKIHADPLAFEPVEKLARRAYIRLTAELLAENINQTLQQNAKACRLHNDRVIIEFVAKNCTVKNENQLILAGDITVVERPVSGQNPPRTLHCQKASLDMEGDQLVPTLTLDVRNAKWFSPQGVESLLARYIIRGLVMPQAVSDRFKSQRFIDDVTGDSVTANLSHGPSKDLIVIQKQLNRKIAKTLAEIRAEIHSRLVFGIGCISLIMIGIALGIILKDGHLLTAFAASSIPAAALITFIIMGKNLTENLSSKALSGISLMWAGFIILTALSCLLYHRLLKY